MRQAVLPGLFVGLALLGGAAYFYWQDRRRKRSGTVQDAVLEFTLPNVAIPFVVGKNEATLQAIEQATNTKIRFREKDDNSQICTIKGNSEACERAEAMVKERAKNPPLKTVEVEVPSTARGKIIGLCGERLEEICKRSQAKVWIDTSGGSDTTEIVKITGTETQINIAKDLIADCVKEDAEARRRLKESSPPKRSPSPKKITETEPRELLPPKTETLKSTSSFNQIEVYVAACVTPSKFYVQIVGPQSRELDILVDAMTEYYGIEENRSQHVISKPALGQVVAAKLNMDDKWYRAEVISVQPDPSRGSELMLDLFFVDYGDNQYVYPKDIFELKPEFLTLRYQAIECFLAYVKPLNPVNPDRWSDEALQRFDEITYMAQWKRLLCKTVTFKPGGRRGSQIPGVELFDISEGQDINIAYQMIVEDLAEPTVSGYFGDLTKSKVLRVDDQKKKEESASPEPPVFVSLSDLSGTKDTNFNPTAATAEPFFAGPISSTSTKPSTGIATSDLLAAERQQNNNFGPTNGTDRNTKAFTTKPAADSQFSGKWSDLLKDNDENANDD